MSWLTDLAGKAEQLLNKVDQTAAVALKSDDVNPIGISTSLLRSDINPYHSSQHPHKLSQQQTASAPFNTTHSSSPTKGIASPRMQGSSFGPATTQISTNSVNAIDKSTAKSKTRIDDDKLFEFLNSANDQSSMPKRAEKIKSKIENSSRVVQKGTKGPVSNLTTAEVSGNDSSSISGNVMVNAMEGEFNDIASNEDDLKETQTNVLQSGDKEIDSPILQAPQSKLRVSSLEFDNGVLKNEIASINQELSKATQRIRSLENELQQSKRKLEQYTSQQFEGDKVARDLQERENDLKQALEAKDSQLAVLRVRLQEADQELIAKRALVDRLQYDNQRIIDDHTSSSGLHDQAIITVQERLQQSEEGLDRERQSFRSAQSESLQRISRLEEELKMVANNYSAVQSKHAEEKSRNNELLNQLKTAKHNVESTQQELADYKVKAQRILQSKEKLIVTLKESNTGTNGDGSEAGNAAASAVEIEELRQERDLLKDELVQANQQIMGLRQELQELESQLQEEIDTARDQYREKEESLREERERKKDLEQELIHLKEESRYLKEDYSRQRTTLQSRIQDRDLEIEKLRKQLVSKQVNTTSQSELESRLNALTESLIQKQTTLEVLSTEKSSLVFQLERLENQLKEQTAYARRTTSTAVNVAEDNDVKPRVPGFMVETPLDGGVTRKVKRVYNTIDTLSIRLGVFLRRYPIARIFVIAYMVLLHFWVMVVLLTYTPEIHGENHQNGRR